MLSFDDNDDPFPPDGAPAGHEPAVASGRPRGGRRWLWWLGLVLASGAGLVALAVLNLWRAVRDGDARAQLDAQRNAVAMGSALDAVLRAPELVDAVLPRQRFVVERGRLVVPPEVQWLEPPGDWVGEPRMGIEVEERLAEAERLEFGEGEGAAALAVLRATMESERVSEEVRAHLRVRAAWVAHRLGDAGERDELLAALPAVRGQLAVSVALMCAARGGPLPVGIERELWAMPSEQIEPVFERLAARGLDVADARAAAERAARWREALRVVRDSGIVEEGAAFAGTGRGALVGPRVAEGRLVLWHRGGPAGARGGVAPAGSGSGASGASRGEGVVVTFQELVDALARPAPLGLPPLAATGELVPLGAVQREDEERPSPSLEELVVPSTGDLPPDGAAAGPDPAGTDVVPVVADFVGVRPLTPVDSIWARPWVLGGVVGGLGLMFGAGLFFSLRAARREAAAMAARAEFLTVVTHELKTPLASIRLLSEMLDEGRVAPDKVGDYYSLLWGESARLTMLIENVLDLGRMERGERAYDLRGQSVEELVGEATDLIRPLMDKEGIVLEFFPWRTATWVDMDRGAMLQALLNVLDNARKYGVEGRRVEVATRPGVAADGTARHEILVRDFGPGIDPMEREGVFQRFKRGAAQMDGSVPGVGLGLYLARSILRRHGGDLVCETPEDGGPGAWFRFVLPMGEQPMLRPGAN